MFHRERPEREYLYVVGRVKLSPPHSPANVDYRPLYKQYEIGTMVWSPLAGGLLTGKVCLRAVATPIGPVLSYHYWLHLLI